MPQQPTGNDRKVVIVVGGSREALIEARNRLALALVIIGPLLIAALAAGGWMVAGAALRPVRRMAQEADATERQRSQQPSAGQTEQGSGCEKPFDLWEIVGYVKRLATGALPVA